MGIREQVVMARQANRSRDPAFMVGDDLPFDWRTCRRWVIRVDLTARQTFPVNP
jgi:hypothetical protein